jgi:two-component system sensor histidine kinase KdpD
MESTLLAAIAHDLKTPVAAARGAIENWAAESGGSEKARLAVDQLGALTRTIEELMEVVRLDAGIAHSHREIVSGAEIVEAAVARFGDALARHTLFVDAAPADATVEVDPAQITEALGHGLENAARYSPPGAEIHVSAAAEGDSVFLRVADRGGGVSPADRERVFERFVRLAPADGIPGTGLGLSIARSLVEMNGGTLLLLEAHEGGTLFEIRLPRTIQAGALAVPRTPSP